MVKQKQKTIYFNDLRSVSLVPITSHWGPLEFTQSVNAGDGYGNDTLMQSGHWQLSLSLERQAILLTNDWVTLSCELFSTDAVLREQDIVFCEDYKRNHVLSAPKEIWLSSLKAQASIHYWVGVLTPETLMWIYKNVQSTRSCVSAATRHLINSWGELSGVIVVKCTYGIKVLSSLPIVIFVNHFMTL